MKSTQDANPDQGIVVDRVGNRVLSLESNSSIPTKLDPLAVQLMMLLSLELTKAISGSLEPNLIGRQLPAACQMRNVI